MIAHRGASGAVLENTLEAFGRAEREGADAVELDVRLTSDGVPVVHHDPALATGALLRFSTLESVRRHPLSNGELVPTLAEVLERFPVLGLCIEVKELPVGREDALLRVIAQGPEPSRCAVHSFDHPLIARLRALSPTLDLGVLAVARLQAPERILAMTGAGTLWQEKSLLDRALVERVHDAGGTVVAWTVNDPEEAASLGALGVDGLCGDYPDRLRRT